jgi:hypothetical protein
MAIQARPQNLQKIEFDVTTAEGPSRVTVITGAIQIWVQAASNAGARRSCLLFKLESRLAPNAGDPR